MHILVFIFLKYMYLHIKRIKRIFWKKYDSFLQDNRLKGIGNFKRIKTEGALVSLYYNFVLHSRLAIDFKPIPWLKILAYSYARSPNYKTISPILSVNMFRKSYLGKNHIEWSR